MAKWLDYNNLKRKSNLKGKVKGNRRIQKMANAPTKSITIPSMRLITKSDLAPIGRGLVATKCTVTVHENGQISFSSLASKTLSVPNIFFAFEPQTRELFCIGATDKNVKQHKADKESIFPCKTSKKGGTYSVASSGLLQSTMVFCDTDKEGKVTKEGRYDYKASGNQVFEAVDHPGSNMVVFQLPIGALPKRAVQKRLPRKKKGEGEGAEGNSATVAASGANGAATQVNVAGTDETLELN